MNPEVFAVVWADFISNSGFVPLSLQYASAGAAVDAAKAMHAKAAQNRVALHDLRAVRLDEADKLETLWKPEI